MTIRFAHPSARPLLVLGLGAALVLPLLACEEEAPPAPEGPRPVKMLELSGGGASATREYPGRIKAGQYSEMSFEVPGKVTKFVYKEGSLVERDAVLAEVDPADYQARYDSAVAKREHARSEHERYKVMYEKDVKPLSEYEMRMRMFDVRSAEAREAKKALDDTVLRAPFDGIMARKLVEVYENVLAKQAVLVMQNDDLLEIKVSVPERDLAEGTGEELSPEEITERLNPRVVVSSLPNNEYPARLKELATVADPTTRTFEATFLFPKPPSVNILGGMTAKVVIDVPEGRGYQGFMVPTAAVIAGEEGGGAVWVIDPETLVASKRSVKLGEMSGTSVEVHEGLAPGDVIALSGVHQLREGVTVRRYEP